MKKIITSIGIVFMGSLLAGIGNYLYYPMSLSFLTREDFGAFMSLLGIYNILGFITAGFSLYINKLISENLEDPQAIRIIFHNCLKLACFIGLILTGVMTLLSGFIAQFIHIQSPLLVILTALSIISALILLVIEGYARGKKNFTLLSSSYMVGAFSKLLIGLTLLSFGFGVFGALLGCILGGYINAGIGFLWASRSITQKADGEKKNIIFSAGKNKIGKELFEFVVLSIFISTLMNIDIILARNIFTESQAGIYATISVIGKFGLFLLLSVESVFYSHIVEHPHRKIPIQLLAIPSIIILGSIGVGLLCTHFLGSFILNILSNGVGEYSQILHLVVLFYGFLTLLSFFLKVSTAKGIPYIIPLMILSSVGLLCVVYTWGSHSLEMFVLSFILIIITTLFINIILFWLNTFLWKKSNTAQTN